MRLLRRTGMQGRNLLRMPEGECWPVGGATACPRRLMQMLQVELRYVTGCPHTDAARALLKECLTELKLDVAVECSNSGDPGG